MNFRAKIFLVTVGILTITLVLSSFLSILSFENSYLKSLISTYEVAGETLKLKIEQALKFGKPLDKFQGMRDLLRETAEDNPKISAIWIEAENGRVLYEFKREKDTVIAAPESDQKTLSDAERTRTIQAEDNYLTIVPLKKSEDRILGRIYLALPEKVVLERMQEMIVNNLGILWPIILTSSFALIFFLALLLFKPLKKDLLGISRILDETEKSDEPEHPEQGEGRLSAGGKRDIAVADLKMQKVMNEIDLLCMQVIVFVERYEETIMDIEKLNAERQNFMHTAEELSRKGKSLESDLQDLDQELNEDERETARAITEENAHLSEMLDIIYGLINDMERITREQTAQAGL
jgi:hypothetical protein